MTKTVLIADDAVFMREMLREILTDAGYEIVAEASDGAEAVEQFREHSPDLVTLDIVMPRKSGFDALQEILVDEPNACVVMCSALGQEALVMEALECGARDFVVKPFKPEQVRSVVARAFQKCPEGVTP
jgi:two-component system chemotaxis response regulator CheY